MVTCTSQVLYGNSKCQKSQTELKCYPSTVRLGLLLKELVPRQVEVTKIIFHLWLSKSHKLVKSHLNLKVARLSLLDLKAPGGWSSLPQGQHFHRLPPSFLCFAQMQVGHTVANREPHYQTVADLSLKEWIWTPRPRLVLTSTLDQVTVDHWNVHENYDSSIFKASLVEALNTFMSLSAPPLAITWQGKLQYNRI